MCKTNCRNFIGFFLCFPFFYYFSNNWIKKMYFCAFCINITMNPLESLTSPYSFFYRQSRISVRRLIIFQVKWLQRIFSFYCVSSSVENLYFIYLQIPFFLSNENCLFRLRIERVSPFYKKKKLYKHKKVVKTIWFDSFVTFN